MNYFLQSALALSIYIDVVFKLSIETCGLKNDTFYFDRSMYNIKSVPCTVSNLESFEINNLVGCVIARELFSQHIWSNSNAIILWYHGIRKQDIFFRLPVDFDM